MTAFSTADDLVINRKIDVNFTTSTATEELENVYEISRCAKWIISNGYEKVKWNFQPLIINFWTLTLMNAHNFHG